MDKHFRVEDNFVWLKLKRQNIIPHNLLHIQFICEKVE